MSKESSEVVGRQKAIEMAKRFRNRGDKNVKVTKTSKKWNGKAVYKVSYDGY